MTRTIGFDLDMTLIDSAPQILQAFQSVAQELAVEIDLAVVEARFGLKLEDELRHWVDEAAVVEAAAIYRRAYIQLARNSTLLPGALGALEAVRAIGDRVAIVTAKHESSAQPCLAATGLNPDSLHTFVHGQEKAAVLRSLGASAYVGDTPADMAAARSAEALSVGVTTGAFDAGELRSAGAAIVLASLEEFPAVFASLAL